MIPSQDQIPYNGIERILPRSVSTAIIGSLKTKFRITELKVETTRREGITHRKSQDQIPYNGIESDYELRQLVEFYRVSRPNSV